MLPAQPPLSVFMHPWSNSCHPGSRPFRGASALSAAKTGMTVMPSDRSAITSNSRAISRKKLPIHGHNEKSVTLRVPVHEIHVLVYLGFRAVIATGNFRDLLKTFRMSRSKEMEKPGVSSSRMLTCTDRYRLRFVESRSEKMGAWPIFT